MMVADHFLKSQEIWYFKLQTRVLSVITILCNAIGNNVWPHPMWLVATFLYSLKPSYHLKFDHDSSHDAWDLGGKQLSVKGVLN